MSIAAGIIERERRGNGNIVNQYFALDRLASTVERGTHEIQPLARNIAQLEDGAQPVVRKQSGCNASKATKDAKRRQRKN